MHDIRWIRENPTAFDAGLKRRGLLPRAAHLISIEERRSAIIRVLEGWRARRKAASDRIHKALVAKNESEVQALKDEVAEAKTSIETLEREQREVDQELKDALAEIPNLPLPPPEVPDGTDERDNVEHHHFGAKKVLGFAAKQHDDLGKGLKEMDFETAAKISGARFVVLKSGLARLERALGQFMLDVHTAEHGYTEVNPPLLVREDAMFGTAQFPKFKDDQFGTERPVDFVDAAKRLLQQFGPESVRVPLKLAQAVIVKLVSEGIAPDDPLLADYPPAVHRQFVDYVWKNLHVVWKDIQNNQVGLWLIPTAEVSLTNLVRESILDEKDLPLRFTALTPCFRAEAGAAGRDTRGMIRQHQFNKVELVSITTPETSKDEHERMLACAEEVLRRLELHYRVMTLCAGDMGFASQKTYDIEVWMPGQGEGGMYREISSCSVCGDFQARRMNARYRPTVVGKSALVGNAMPGAFSPNAMPKGPRFVHTLNGSGTAVGRALIAVMETYQQQGGSIAVPDALQPYMGGLKVIEKGS
jgi:seryl-tRNA synthetase